MFERFKEDRSQQRLPEGAMFIDGMWIAEVNGKVVEYPDIPAPAGYEQGSQQPAAYEYSSTPRVTTPEYRSTPSLGDGVPLTKFRMELEGYATLDRLVNIGGQQAIAPQIEQPQYPHYALQEPPYAGGEYTATYDDPEPASDYEEQEESVPVGQLEAWYEQRRRDELALLGQGDDDGQEYVDVPKKRKKSKKAALAGVAIGLAVSAGPAIQAANAADEAADACAKEGIFDIMGDPTCFGDQFTARFTDVSNITKWIPKEHK